MGGNSTSRHSTIGGFVSPMQCERKADLAQAGVIRGCRPNKQRRVTNKVPFNGTSCRRRRFSFSYRQVQGAPHTLDEIRSGTQQPSSNAQAKIGLQLPAMDSDVVNQGVPHRFAEIRRRLDERSSGEAPVPQRGFVSKQRSLNHMSSPMDPHDKAMMLEAVSSLKPSSSSGPPASPMRRPQRSAGAPSALSRAELTGRAAPWPKSYRSRAPTISVPITRSAQPWAVHDVSNAAASRCFASFVLRAP
jgi:hypothetical protein